MVQEEREKIVSIEARTTRLARRAQRAARGTMQSEQTQTSLQHDTPDSPSALEAAFSAVATSTNSAVDNYVSARSTLEQPQVGEILSLPRAEERQIPYTAISFVICVILPVIVAVIYYAGFASDRYVVEFRFAVRETAGQGPSTAGGADLATMISGAPVASNASENYMVTEYLTSRAVVDALQARIDLKSRYSQPDIDWWSRFNSALPTESFVRYWQGMTRSYYDYATGIAVTQVTAFTPDDAYLIATTMMQLAEELVNDVAMRPRRDTLRFAEQEVKRAAARLNEIRAALHEYRNKEAVIDPTSSVVTGNAQLAQTLRQELAQYQMELATLFRQKLRADSPQMSVLQSRIHSAKQQLAEVEKEIASSNGQRALSSVVGRYEELEFERQTAQTILTSTIQSLEKARVGAITQHLYITPFVSPSRPESSIAPNRPIAILTIGFGCFFLWTISLLTFRSIREHLT